MYSFKLTRGYATKNPDKYNALINSFNEVIEKAEPNDAYYALAGYNIPIITMNCDRLHIRAGSKDVLETHGVYPDLILYGDKAPLPDFAHEVF